MRFSSSVVMKLQIIKRFVIRSFLFFFHWSPWLSADLGNSRWQKQSADGVLVSIVHTLRITSLTLCASWQPHTLHLPMMMCSGRRAPLLFVDDSVSSCGRWSDPVSVSSDTGNFYLTTNTPSTTCQRRSQDKMRQREVEYSYLLCLRVTWVNNLLSSTSALLGPVLIKTWPAVILILIPRDQVQIV